MFSYYYLIQFKSRLDVDVTHIVRIYRFLPHPITKQYFFFSLCTTFYTTFFRWVEIVKATFFCFVAYFHWMFNWNGINRCLRHLRSKFLIKSAFCFSGHWSFSCLINSKLSEMYKYFAVLFHCDDWQFYHQNWFRMWAERRRKKK